MAIPPRFFEFNIVRNSEKSNLHRNFSNPKGRLPGSAEKRRKNDGKKRKMRRSVLKTGKTMIYLR